MSARVSSLGRLWVLGVLCLGLSQGCKGDEPQPPPSTPVPDAAVSQVVLTPERELLANGQDRALITIAVRRRDGMPLSGRTVEVAVPGEGNTVTQPESTTDAEGRTTASVVSTRAGIKHVKVTVLGVGTGGPVVLDAQPSLTFVSPVATRLEFSNASRDSTVGMPIPGLEVRFVDAQGQEVTSATGEVTLSLATHPAGAELEGALTTNAVGGRALFNALLRKVGVYQLKAEAAGVEAAVSDPFEIGAGAAARFDLSSASGLVTAGTAASITVTVRDGAGNLATNYRGTISLSATDDLATLPLAHAFTDQDRGSFTFTGIVLRRAGPQRVRFHDASNPLLDTDGHLEVAPAAASALAFAPVAERASVHATLPLVSVLLRDEFGNAVPVGTPEVTVGLEEPGMLTGVLRVAPYEGVAYFTTLQVHSDGVFHLTASAPGLTSARSTSLTIVDDVPPARPVLSVKSLTADSVTVTWVAVGDDGTEGTATSQELRYSAQPITTPAEFQAATPVSMGAPAAPGTTETATLIGLSATQTYHVVLAVTDNQGNTAYSNDLAVSTRNARVKRLAFTPQPSNGTAGIPLASVHVSLLDEAGAVVTTASAPVTLTLVGGTGFQPRQEQAVDGVATFTGVRVDRAGEYRLAASAEGFTVESQPFVIAPSSARRFEVTGLVAPVVAGQSQTLEVVVRDNYDNLVPTYAGTVRFTSTDPRAVLPSSYTFTAADAGRHTFTGVKLNTSGYVELTVADELIPRVAGTTGVYVTSDAPLFMEMSSLPATWPAGTERQMVLDVRDAYGNLVTGYRGEVAFTSDDPRATLPSRHVFTESDAGRYSFTVRLESAGPRVITAKEVVGTMSTTSDTRVLPGDAVALTLALSTSTPAAGAPVAATVTVVDAFGNHASGYRGTVAFRSDDAAATLPGSHAFTESDAGQRVFNVGFARAGSTSLTAEDTEDPSLTAASTVTVSAGVASALTVSLEVGPYTAGVAYGFTVTARDRFGNLAPGYTGTVGVTTTDARAEPITSHAFTAEDQGAHTFSVAQRTAGAQTVSFADVALGVTATQALTVEPAAPERLRFLSSPESVSVRQVLAPTRVAVSDAFGNTVSGVAPAVTLTLTGNGAPELRGTVTRTPVAGVAEFSDLAVDQEGAYSLVARAAGSDLEDASVPLTIVDDVAPSAVAALEATLEGDDAIRLRWLATGDDGVEGQAARYELRYASSPLTAANFGTGTLVATAAPGAPGAQEQALVTDLGPGTYYFAVRVLDNQDNASALATTSLSIGDPCEGFVCEPRAATCAENGVDLVTYTGACVVEAGAPTCQYASTPTACTGVEGVCYQGACTTAAAPGEGEVVITELMHTPTNGTTEYVEVTSTVDRLLNVNGLTLESLGAVPGTFTVDRGEGAAVVLPARGSFVLARDADSETNGGVHADVAYRDALDLEPTGVLSVQVDGVVLDALSYDESFPSTPGSAISLSSTVQSARRNRYAWNWCLATQELAGGNHGSPGDARDTCGVVYEAPVDRCFIQSPKSFPKPLRPGEDATVTSRFSEAGVTGGNPVGNDYFPFVDAELGFGTDPAQTESWTWVPASFNPSYVAEGNSDDEMAATLRIPAAGSYFYGFRYRFPQGPVGSEGWTYCDQDGVVTQGGIPHYGSVTVKEPSPVSGHVVISEVSGRGVSSQTDEFIELYNPTDENVDLGGWQVQYKSATGSSYSGSVTIPAGKVIPAHGYFLLAHVDFSGAATTPPDVTYSFDMSASTTAGGHVRIGPGLTTSPNDVAVDKVAWGTGNSPEGAAAPAHPAAGGSLERKALPTSTSASMGPGGADADRGNGTDSDRNADDFVTRASRQPQCSTSPREEP
ncbi:lamin tail domain-containing protein [Myxococcus stipitatus]|uniref:Ig-like domain-containing protein n=1 Tax=Myxococcus stipitatus TaxID=83455 RepID=UPI001F18295B|nr:lamin tail domain-containing protein [Myxococcus stipitatus]MCE9667297.1 lamin tail domain-containing protein [Myxococcus stipitatus]